MDIYINGESISDIIVFQGFQRKGKRVNGPNAGTNILGGTILDILADKEVFDFALQPLTPARYNRLRDQLTGLVTVTLDDPDAGASSYIMYAPSRPEGGYDKSVGRWMDVSFTLEEK